MKALDKLTEAVQRTDLWIIIKIFYPLSGKIDERFHINPWRVASYFLLASTALLFADMLCNVHSLWFDAAFGPIMLLIRWFELSKLSKISEAYERNPMGMMPSAWAFFMSPLNRIWGLWFGLLFFTPLDLAAAVVTYKSPLAFAFRFIPGLWITVGGIGYYFAVCPRPPAKRKEKKVEAPSWATPAMIKT